MRQPPHDAPSHATPALLTPTNQPTDQPTDQPTNPLNPQSNRTDDERAMIYHYRTKSAQDWQKRDRKGTNGIGGPIKPVQTFLTVDKWSDQVCLEGPVRAAELKQAFGPLLRSPRWQEGSEARR
jgi:hypothetical protein